MSLYYELKDNAIVISGSTFPYKDRIKQMGPARFDGINKALGVTLRRVCLESVKEMCKRVGGGKKEVKAVVKNAPTAQIAPQISSQTAKPNMEGMKIAELMESPEQTIKQNFYSPIWIIADIKKHQFQRKKLFTSILPTLMKKKCKSHTLTVRAVMDE